MDKLPPEVLCDIFLTVCQSSKEDDTRHLRLHGYLSNDNPLSMPISAPLYISHVCRAWRRTALSQRDLWSYMCITFTNGSCRRMLVVLKEVFDTWLSRTRGSPLNITLKCFTLYRSWKSLDVAEHMIKALMDQQHRWKDMWIDMFISGSSRDFPDNFTLSDMPLLSSLNITVESQFPRIAVDISRCSYLKQLSVVGADVFICGKTIQTLKEPSALISSYNRPLLVRSCLSFLREAPHLKHFCAIFNVTGAQLTNRDSHLSHLLQTLKVGSGNTAALFLDTLPALKALSCSIVGSHETFLRFIRRSMPPLTFLEVENVNENTLLPVLHLTPALTDLRVSKGHLTELFFRELAISDVPDRNERLTSSAVVCPELMSLHLLSYAIAESNDTCIMTFIGAVKSRHDVLGTFQKVKLYVSTMREFAIDAADIDQYAEDLTKCLERDKVVIEGDNASPNPLLSLQWIWKFLHSRNSIL